MHLARQITMTISPSISSNRIAKRIVADAERGQQAPVPIDRLDWKACLDASKTRGGFKNLAIDALSLPTRLVLGVDRQPFNVPEYHTSYLSDFPKPLPGAVQFGVTILRQTGIVVGSVVGAAASILGSIIGDMAKSLRLIDSHRELDLEFSETALVICIALFEIIAYPLQLVTKANRIAIENLLAALTIQDLFEYHRSLAPQH